MHNRRTDAALTRQLVSRLSTFERNVLMLFYVEKLSMLEIGAVLRVSDRQVERTLDAIKQRTRMAISARAA